MNEINTVITFEAGIERDEKTGFWRPVVTRKGLGEDTRFVAELKPMHSDIAMELAISFAEKMRDDLSTHVKKMVSDMEESRKKPLGEFIPRSFTEKDGIVLDWRSEVWQLSPTLNRDGFNFLIDYKNDPS